MENRAHRLIGSVPSFICGPWGFKFHSFFFLFSFLLRPASWENQICPEVITPTGIESLLVENFPQGSGEGDRPLVAAELIPLV